MCHGHRRTLKGMSDPGQDQGHDQHEGQGRATTASIRRIEEASGLAWTEFVAAFEAAGGTDADHTQLARAIVPVLDGRVDNPGWWAQGATVEYERTIGRRVEGQSSAGDFQVAASRTLTGTAADLRDRAGALLQTAGAVAGMSVGTEPRTSETPKRHYWRSALGEAAKLEAAVEAAAQKGDGAQTRVRVTLTASGLADQEQRDAARADLKAVLEDLG